MRPQAAAGGVGAVGWSVDSMAGDGDGRSGAGGAQGAASTEELDPGPGVGGMLLNFSILVLVLAACYGVYRRWLRRAGAGAAADGGAPALPRMGRRDFTLEQLREYDGERNPRILIAVNMKVFDVTSGKKFYGRGKDEEGKRQFGITAPLGRPSDRGELPGRPLSQPPRPAWCG